MVLDTVAKRTRLQRALVEEKFSDELRKSRISARRDHRKRRASERVKRKLGFENGGQDDEDDDDDDVVMVIDKELFEKKVGVSGSKKGFEEKEKLNLFNGDDHGHGGDEVGRNSHVGFAVKDELGMFRDDHDDSKDEKISNVGCVENGELGRFDHGLDHHDDDNAEKKSNVGCVENDELGRFDHGLDHDNECEGDNVEKKSNVGCAENGEFGRFDHGHDHDGGGGVSTADHEHESQNGNVREKFNVGSLESVELGRVDVDNGHDDGAGDEGKEEMNVDKPNSEDSDCSVQIIDVNWDPYAFDDELDGDSEDGDDQGDRHGSGEDNVENVGLEGENRNNPSLNNVNNARAESSREELSDILSSSSSSSSEEDVGEGSDKEFRVDESEVSCSLESSGCSDSDDDTEESDSGCGGGGCVDEDEDVNNHAGRSSDDEEIEISDHGDVLLQNNDYGWGRPREIPHDSIVQTQFFDGLVLPKFPENNAGDDDTIGNRIRGRSRKNYPRKRIKDGTIKCPVNIDEMSSGGEYGEDDEGERNGGDHGKYQRDVPNSQTPVVHSLKRKRGIQTKHKVSSHTSEFDDEGHGKHNHDVPECANPSVSSVKRKRDNPVVHSVKRKWGIQPKHMNAVKVTSHTGEFYDDEGHGKHNHVVPECANPLVSSAKRKRGRPCKDNSLEVLPPSKRKRVRGLKEHELQKIILDTMGNEGSASLEDLMSSKCDSYLPLKFRFGVEKVSLPEKTEEEKELERLWKDMEIALGACHIGSDFCSSDNQDASPSDYAANQEKLCAEGKHHLILDEEAGLVCKFCLFVYMEIRDMTPEFSEYPFGKDSRGYRRFQPDDEIAFDNKIHLGDLAYNSGGGHAPPQGTVWDLLPQPPKGEPGIRESLYPHQQEGFEFIWRNVAGGIKLEDLSKARKSDSGGCIICHAPGTGKTRLAIVFLQSYLKQYPDSRPVIIAPRSMLLTWEQEFARWDSGIPFFNLNVTELSKEEDLVLYSMLKDSKVRKSKLLAKLYTWAKGRGVLGISYCLFEKYAGKRENNDDSLRQVLLKMPGILVLDEGHTPRNGNSLIYKVFSDVQTKRRIILSGTPFQNNLQELMNTISLVRPEFVDPVLAGSWVDSQKKRGRPRSGEERRRGNDQYNGKLEDSRRIAELGRRIKPFVHVHKGEILRKTLRGLFDSVLVLEPSELQKVCFHTLRGLNNFLDFNHLFSIASVHPYLLLKTKNAHKYFNEDTKALLEKNKNDLDAGAKVRFLYELMRLSGKEKVLVFSQYLHCLAFIKDMLKSQFNWREGNEILYMDGKQEVRQRQHIMEHFNQPQSEARILLASTRACSEGIRLVGASRVVLLDVVWNPSVERQAISRAYRIGQKKDVYVYHLISHGSPEGSTYYRQVMKERLSELVFSSSGGENAEEVSTSSKVSMDAILDEMIHNDKMKPMFKEIICQAKADNLIDSFNPLSS